MNPEAQKQDAAPAVAAVFATMNRRETALECVRRLAAQSRPPQSVWVADNGSTDGTPEGLKHLEGLPFALHVIAMPGNAGNAGGIQRAMEDAFTGGADAVWILDDDSWPRPEALKEMLSHGWHDGVVRHPVQIDPRGGGFTWPLQAAFPDGWRLVRDMSGMPSGKVLETRASWTGALVPKRVREAVGPVAGELFIRGEDEEYPWRIAAAGFRFEVVPTAALDHPAPEKLVEWRFMGRHFFLEPGLADWKLHYKVRNMVWLKRRQSGMLAAVAIAGAYVIGVMKVDGFGGGRLGILRRAVSEGLRGELGPLECHR